MVDDYMNPVVCEKQIQIGSKPYILKFSWKALAEIEHQYGDNPNVLDPEIAAGVAAAGLRDRHPEMTAEKIFEISPPFIPFANAINQALQYAYFGIEPPSENDGVKKKDRRKGGWFRRFVRRWAPASHRSSSGR